MSLYAEYIKEREGRECIELASGFAAYCFLPDKTCLIADMYVRPDKRRTGYGRELVQMVMDKAREAGSTRLMVAVDPSLSMSEASVKFWEALGCIMYKKDVSAGTLDFYLKEIV